VATLKDPDLRDLPMGSLWDTRHGKHRKNYGNIKDRTNPTGEGYCDALMNGDILT